MMSAIANEVAGHCCWFRLSAHDHQGWTARRLGRLALSSCQTAVTFSSFQALVAALPCDSSARAQPRYVWTAERRRFFSLPHSKILCPRCARLLVATSFLRFGLKRKKRLVVVLDTPIQFCRRTVPSSTQVGPKHGPAEGAWTRCV